MTFKEQLAKVLNGFDITYTDNNNPDQAITEMVKIGGKELVLEVWKTKDYPLLFTILMLMIHTSRVQSFICTVMI